MANQLRCTSKSVERLQRYRRERVNRVMRARQTHYAGIKRTLMQVEIKNTAPSIRGNPFTCTPDIFRQIMLLTLSTPTHVATNLKNLQDMLTPSFDVSQTDEFVIIVLRVPYVKVSLHW